MEETAKCKKCGRVLKSAISIARGMGPKCAGLCASSGRSIKVKPRKSSSKAYPSLGSIHMQVPLFSGELPSKRISKRELYRRRREERRRQFESREPFQCGILLPKRKPLVYMPLEGGMWKEDPSGRIISHERLQEYLTRYRFI